ncbi:MAG: arginase family protein [Candidatus Pacearchaeota archaeon]
MAKYYLHNSEYKDSDVVILAVPDNSGSHSSRASGVKLAPDYIRKVSQKMDVYKWKKEKSRKVESNRGAITSKVCDIGNIKKKKVENKILTIVSDDKIPITLGGDHSITSQIVKGVSEAHNPKFAFVYFDAHPDFRCGFGDYYGSVLCEFEKLKNVSFKNSVLIGMRAPEKSELLAIKKSGLLVVTPEDIELYGMKKIIAKINKHIGNFPVYVSIDLDSMDPSVAPGVDTPVPAGITSVQLLAVIESMKKKRIIGADIMELNPKFDKSYVTAHLASRIIAEIIYSCNK